MKSILIIFLACLICATRQQELSLTGEKTPLQVDGSDHIAHVESADVHFDAAHVESADVHFDAAHVESADVHFDTAHVESADTHTVGAEDTHTAASLLHFDNPSYNMVDEALEKPMTIFSYDLESTTFAASYPALKYIIQFVHWVELLPARSLQMLFILVNNVSIYLDCMNTMLDAEMWKVRVMLLSSHSTYPVARLLCTLFFIIYSNIIPVLLLVVNAFSWFLEQSLRQLVIYQGLNLIVGLLPFYLIFVVSKRFFPRFLARPVIYLASIIWSLIKAPFRWLKKGWNCVKAVFVAFINYVKGFFGGKSSSGKGKGSNKQKPKRA